MNCLAHIGSIAFTAFILSACIISENENDAGTYPCETDQDCMRGYECDLSHPNLSNFEDDFPDGLEGIGLCVPGGQSTGSEASDATDASDPGDTSDSTDVADSTDPSDSEFCDDPLAVNGGTDQVCAYDDLSDGVSNAGFEVRCGETENRAFEWQTTTTNADVFVVATGTPYTSGPSSDLEPTEIEERFVAFSGSHAVRLSNRNNGERPEAGIAQERPLSGIQATSLLMRAAIQVSPLDTLDSNAFVQMRLSYHANSGENDFSANWFDITSRLTSQDWTEVWLCTSRTANEPFAQLGVRIASEVSSGAPGTGTIYVDDVGFWEVSQCPSDLDAISADELSRYRVSFDSAQVIASTFDGNQCRLSDDPNACFGVNGQMDCVNGPEGIAPPNANPTCVPIDAESGPRQCGFDCTDGFTVPNALTNTCVLEGSSPGMAQSWDGAFVRGCQSCSVEESSTQFEMEVAPFEIDLTEVTVEAYRICVTSGDCERPANGGTYADTGNHQKPVTHVTHLQAAEYCKLQGKRLPTEAEWESAARVSETNESRVTSDFPWGNSPEPDCRNAILANNDQACPREAPVKVGSSPRGYSFYGVADLTGNVREWVFDRYLSDTYSVNVQDRGAYGGDNNATLNEAVIRGGSYLTPNYPNAYGWYRTGAGRTNRAIDVGFRCAKLKNSRDNGQECIADVDCTSRNCSISDGVIRGVCQAN